MFKDFASLVHAQYNTMRVNELYTTIDGDALWAAYLAAFPEGTDPIYRVNTEHTCSCCRNFVRNLGNTVAVVDGKLQSVWSITGAPYPYDVVAEELDKLVLSSPITNLFRTKEHSYGAEVTPQLVDGTVINWNHFHGKVAARHHTSTPDKAAGDYRTSVQVFQRGLEELSEASVKEVIELIQSNALYRGEEHLKAVKAFRQAQLAYLSWPLDSQERDRFLWISSDAPVARFRNTVIGTLVQELSEGIPLEHAVRSFESKVAPTNYKRTTALITESMVNSAMKTISDLGLESALERRFANIGDITVNNVIWADNSVKSLMKGGVHELLLKSVTPTTRKSPPENISIEKFMADVVPTAQSIDMLVQGQHSSNLCSLTAPVHADTCALFKWGNNFAWSYNGNVTDSIKERVKAAGGNVTNAKLRVSLSWGNYDDLDIHVWEPNGNEISFRNKCYKLDVDMNAGYSKTRTPVENVSWTSVPDGNYTVKVHQFSRRETTDVGFVVEVENEGQLFQLAYKAPVVGTVDVCTLTLKRGVITQTAVAKGLVGGGISQEVWGIATETFVKVNTLLFSPNHWDGEATGNKHWFFILEGCKNPEPTRGIYNEYLKSSLEPHRKVFEVLGNKSKCPVVEQQLSGLGFSSTRKDVVTVKVQGVALQKTYNVQF